MVLPYAAWVHGDLNPGSSPCKGDVITELDYEPTLQKIMNPLNIPRRSSPRADAAVAALPHRRAPPPRRSKAAAGPGRGRRARRSYRKIQSGFASPGRGGRRIIRVLIVKMRHFPPHPPRNGLAARNKGRKNTFLRVIMAGKCGSCKNSFSGVSARADPSAGGAAGGAKNRIIIREIFLAAWRPRIRQIRRPSTPGYGPLRAAPLNLRARMVQYVHRRCVYIFIIPDFRPITWPDRCFLPPSR